MSLFCISNRHDETEEGLRGGPARLPLRGIQGTDGG